MKLLYNIWKTELPFEAPTETKEEENSESDDPSKKIVGYYDAWRKEDKSEKEGHHRLKIWLEKDEEDGKNIYYLSTTDRRKHELLGENLDKFKANDDEAELQANGDWLWQSGWRMRRFETFDYAFKLEGP